MPSIRIVALIIKLKFAIKWRKHAYLVKERAKQKFKREKNSTLRRNKIKLKLLGNSINYYIKHIFIFELEVWLIWL